MYYPPRPTMKGVEYLLHTHMDIHCGCHDFILLKVAKFQGVANNVYNKRLVIMSSHFTSEI